MSAPPPAHWPTFPPETLQRLFDAVDTDDVVDPQVTLPDTIVVACPEGTAERCYALCLQFWKEGAPRESLLRLVRKPLDNVWLSADERLEFKYIRATYKHLRFAQRLYSRNHRSNLLFHLTTVVLGHFQDAFRSGRRWHVVSRGLMLRVLFSKPAWSLMRRAMERTSIDGEHGVVAYQKSEMRRLRKAIERDVFAGHEFHVVRKIVSMQVSFYDTLRSLEPDDHAYRMSRFLAAINGRMGARHDEMVAEDLLGRRPYATPAPLGKETRALLDALIAHFPF